MPCLDAALACESYREFLKYFVVYFASQANGYNKFTDYSVSDPEGNDLTPSTFEGPLLLFVMVDVKKASNQNQNKINTLVGALDGKVRMLILTSSTSELTETYRHENQFAVPYAFADATVLKTIIRSNPGLALWKDGKVLGNWHYNDVPDEGEILQLLSQ